MHGAPAFAGGPCARPTGRTPRYARAVRIDLLFNSTDDDGVGGERTASECIASGTLVLPFRAAETGSGTVETNSDQCSWRTDPDRRATGGRQLISVHVSLPAFV